MTVGVSLALPRAAAVTDALLEDVPPFDDAVVSELRRRLVAALAPLAAELPPRRRLVVDAYRFSAALRAPETCGELLTQSFSPSPAACRRAIGIAAVERCLRRKAPAPGPAVAGVLADGAHDVELAARGRAPAAPWWADWYGSLPAAAQSVVAAEAVTWATQLWTALDWDRLTATVVGGHDDWWAVPGHPNLALRNRAEVRARLGRRSLLVLRGRRVPDGAERTELAFAALVAAMAAGARAVPGRVLGLWPECGQVRVLDVDAEMLGNVVDDVVGAVATWVDACIDHDGTPGGGRSGRRQPG